VGVGEIERGEIYGVTGNGVGIRIASKGSGDQRFHNQGAMVVLPPGNICHGFAIFFVGMKEVSGVVGEKAERASAPRPEPPPRSGDR